MPQKILVYADAGASPGAVRNLVRSLKQEPFLQGYQIERIRKETLAAPAWRSQAAMLIIPGGRDVYYHRDLQGFPNKHIKEYVEEGGRYLGICAGAYYGCASISFEKGTPLEIIEQRELAFYPGEARGPAYGKGLFRYESESGARLSMIQWMNSDGDKGKEYHTYFNGGCAFVNPENYGNTRVLARYRDIDRTPAAVVECAVGKGKAVLCGVHPEYAASDLAGNDPYLVPIYKKLAAEENARRKLFFNLLSCLLVRVTAKTAAAGQSWP